VKKPLCIVAGVGPGNGLSLCNRYYKEGYRVAIIARDLSRLIDLADGRDGIFPFACDLSNTDHIIEVFSAITDELGTPEVVIYNAGSGVFGPASEVSLNDFEETWKINALGLLSVANLLTPDMIANGGGSLLVTGATASLRGGANFAAFSSAKAAQRNLTQSLARSLGSQGIHVALVIIDGIIDMPRTRARFADKPDDYYMQPDAIADTYYHLSQQEKSAWTFEIDLRTFHETW